MVSAIIITVVVVTVVIILLELLIIIISGKCYQLNELFSLKSSAK